MPLWHLLPLDSTSDHWRASTYKGEVIVRAASEAEPGPPPRPRFLGHTRGSLAV